MIYICESYLLYDKPGIFLSLVYLNKYIYLARTHVSLDLGPWLRFPLSSMTRFLSWWLRPPTLPPRHPWAIQFQWPCPLQRSNHPCVWSHPGIFYVYLLRYTLIQGIYLFWSTVPCTLPTTYGTIKIWNSFITAKYFFRSLCSECFALPAPGNHRCFLLLWLCLFWGCHRDRII